MQQYRNVFEIVNEARKKGITFDTETLGFYSGQPMFSASFARWGVKTPTTAYFDVTAHAKNASVYGRKLWDELNKANPNRESTTYKKFGKTLIQELRQRPFLVGHNLQYDLGWLYESLPKGERAGLQMMFSGTSDQRLNALREKMKLSKKGGPMLTAKEMLEYRKHKFAYGKIDSGGGIIGKSLKDAEHNVDGFLPAYHKFIDYISAARREHKVAVADTLQMSKLFTGLASDLNLVQNKKSIGAKLEFMMEALGQSTKSAHTDIDVLYNQKLLDAFSHGDIDKMAKQVEKLNADEVGLHSFSLSELSEDGQNLVKMFRFLGNEDESKNIFNIVNGKLPYKTIGEFNIYDSVGKAFIENEKEGRIAAKVKTGRKPIYIQGGEDRSKILNHFAKRYNRSVDEISSIWNYHEDMFSDLMKSGTLDYAAAEARMTDQSEKVVNYIKTGIKDFVKPRAQKHIFSDALFPSSSIKEAIKSPTTRKMIMYGALAVAGATAFSVFSGGYDAPNSSKIPSKDDNYNTIEGLHPGGGVNKEVIRHNTDFGSGYKGGVVSKAFDFMTELVSGFSQTVRQNKALIGTAAIPGFAFGYYEGKKNQEVNWQHLASAVGFDMVDDIAIAAAPIIASRIPKFQNLSKYLSHPIVAQAGMGLLGFTLGKTAGEIFATAQIPSKDDNYNTIEGLFHGGIAEKQRHKYTDFGSGYQGPNPQLEADYNKAKDVYKYQWMRASQIGLSEPEMYKYMTQEHPEVSEYVSASANAGTALHEYMQAMDFKSGFGQDAEHLILDRKNKISGHIDIIRKDMGVGDYKTVSAGIFNAIKKSGKPKPHHKAQVMYYLGQMGEKSGYIQYVNRDNIKQQMTFEVKFDPYMYQREIAKVERVRARVMADLAAGRLKKSNLPMAAGPATLTKASQERETPQQYVQTLDEKRKVFHEEMQYLNTVRRGMPHYGAGAKRISKRNQEKNQSTQGIGLQIYNHRNKHHVM